jgi:hypothetical protein
MSLLTKAFDPPALADPVPATALVIMPDLGYSGFTRWSATMQLLVTVPGSSPVVVSHQEMVDRDKAPVAGAELSVLTERGDPSRLAIRWDQVPTIEERIARQDPVIFDPAGTWNRVEKARAAATPAVVPRPAPWGDGTIPDWPGTAKIGRRRVPGTAYVVGQSDDPSPYMNGDDFRPPGHYSYRGILESDPFGFVGWLLLLVVPPDGQRYADYSRRRLRRSVHGSVLAVTIKEGKPSDIDIEWKHTPKTPEPMQADLATQLAEMSTGLSFSGLPPGIAERLNEFGLSSAGATPAPAAAPTDPSHDLSRLEQLRAAGVLNDEEYQAERAKIIAKL